MSGAARPQPVIDPDSLVLVHIGGDHGAKDLVHHERVLHARGVGFKGGPKTVVLLVINNVLHRHRQITHLGIRCLDEGGLYKVAVAESL